MKLVKEEIYSRVDEGLLLHIICRPQKSEEKENRAEIVPENNFIQCSYLTLPLGKTFRPHKHIKKDFLWISLQMLGKFISFLSDCEKCWSYT